MNTLPFVLILSCVFPSGNKIDSIVGEYFTAEQCQEEQQYLSGYNEHYKPKTHQNLYVCKSAQEVSK